jgi:ABC-2 type transport system permease protein
VVFFFAIWLAYLIRTMTLSLLGMITFWTTRVSAIFEMYFAAELVLSGRLVPLTLMPQWVQNLAWYFPFRWAFGFPIETLAGNLSTSALLSGLAMQVAWIVIGVIAANLLWRVGIKKFSAVGG